MKQIKTVRYAIVNNNDRLAKVGSSQRPATFSDKKSAEYAFDTLCSRATSDLHLVEIWSTEYKTFKYHK